MSWWLKKYKKYNSNRVYTVESPIHKEIQTHKPTHKTPKQYQIAFAYTFRYPSTMMVIPKNTYIAIRAMLYYFQWIKMLAFMAVSIIKLLWGYFVFGDVYCFGLYMPGFERLVSRYRLGVYMHRNTPVFMWVWFWM